MASQRPEASIMPKFDKIEDLISELYRNRKLFAALFDKRINTINEDAVLSLLDDDQEKLERLTAYGLLFRSQTQITLESRLQEFFEEFMEVDETVHILYIQENLDRIKEFQSYYLKEQQAIKKDQYLLRIKKSLRSISRITLMNVKTLRNNTDETYKGESNFDIKREKLNNIRTQRDALEGVIKAVEHLLENDLFFKTAADDELLMIVHRLKVALHDSYNNLIEIQQQVIDYLNYIEKRVQVVEKVLRLKTLRDKHYLREQTNFYELAGGINHLPVKKPEPTRSKLSIADMQEKEELQIMILKIKDKLKNKHELKMNVAGEIPPDALINNESIENTVNMGGLKDLFLQNQQDLFSFMQQHQFAEEVDTIERVRLYCRLASLFESELYFTEETAIYNNMEYAMIYPTIKTANIEYQ
ncbi:hypothetical protein DMA11_12200 [Marinilabiliaceae bacterium JC017]|nr:hypothetical protein DMA11_12200 [Marinilabiliaceae bacterium JC017]